MRSPGLVVVASLTLPLIFAAAGPARADVLRREVVQRVGNDRFGGALRRSVTATHAGANGALACESSVTGRILGHDLRVLTVLRRAEGRLQGKARSYVRTRVELLGTGTITVPITLRRSVRVRTFAVPVPVGPFPITIEGQVGLTLEVGGHLRDLGLVQVGLTGSATLGGTVGVGVGVPGAKVGVDGVLDLVKGELPATATFTRRDVTLDVRVVLSSGANIGAFVEVGFGPFKKKWRIRVPFLTFTFARRELPIAHAVVRG
jgi:hypothetical protein